MAGEMGHVDPGRRLTRTGYIDETHTLDGGIIGDGVGYDGSVLVRVTKLINVEVFGVKHNGVHDDAPNLKDATDSLIAAGGGGLYYPPGQYRLATRYEDDGNGYAIYVPSNSVFAFSGQGATELLCDYADSSILYSRSESRIVMHGGVTLNGAGVADNADCLKFLAVTDFTLHHIEAQAARMGIQLIGCQDGSLVSCDAHNQVQDGVGDDARCFSILDLGAYTGTARIRAVNCWGKDSEDHGWVIAEDASDIQLSNCGALSCGGSGLRASDSLIQVVNFLSRANLIGLDIINSSGSRVSGHAIGNSQHGLRVLGTQRARFDMTCRDNSVAAANTYSGVYLADYGGLASILNNFGGLVSGNTIATGQKYGFENAGSEGYNTIVGAILQNNQTAAAAYHANDVHDHNVE